MLPGLRLPGSIPLTPQHPIQYIPYEHTYILNGHIYFTPILFISNTAEYRKNFTGSEEVCEQIILIALEWN